MLICMSIVILIGVIQHIFSERQRSSLRANEMRGLTIGVVLVAPPGAEVEARVTALLHAAARPECIRFYVAKLCESTNDVPSLSNARVRVCTRMHYVRASRNSAPRLRARLIHEVLEQYVLCLGWNHEAEMGWDETLINLHGACPKQRSVLLTTRLAPTEKGVTFLAVSEFGTNRMRLSSYAFAVPPKRATPTLAMSAQVAFAETQTVRGAWVDADVFTGKGIDEDATLTTILWMAGVDFFTPQHSPFVLSTGAAECTDTEGRFVWGKAHVTRSRAELLTTLGIRNGKATSRARAGLTQGATAQERFDKLGQAFRMRRDI